LIFFSLGALLTRWVLIAGRGRQAPPPLLPPPPVPLCERASCLPVPVAPLQSRLWPQGQRAFLRLPHQTPKPPQTRVDRQDEREGWELRTRVGRESRVPVSAGKAAQDGRVLRLRERLVQEVGDFEI
jgi:hypothetical protein